MCLKGPRLDFSHGRLLRFFFFFFFTFLLNSQTWLVLTSPANLVCDTLGLHILCVFINLNM